MHLVLRRTELETLPLEIPGLECPREVGHLQVLAAGAIYLKGDVITNNGVIRATGGISTNSSPMNGGGGRVAYTHGKICHFRYY